MRNEKRPNIIIFNPDQMRADALAHLGNPASSTPFLDEFSRTDAVSFRNAYCQNPVCVPSRCSFFTGLYPHVSGHRTMQYLLHEEDSTLFSELKEAGYYVWMNDRNDLLAGQASGLEHQHSDEIFFATGQSEGAGPVNKDFRGKPGDKNYYSHYEGRLETDKDGRYISDDDLSVNAAIERLKNPVDGRPICMFLGLMYPHTPYGVEEPYFSMIDSHKPPPRASKGQGKSLMQERLRELMGMQDYTEEDYDRIRTCYLGMCRKVDDQFRRLCEALKEIGEYDNSSIFFFSDHGDYTGDYDLVEKAQNTFEDCLTRVPFLIKPPKGFNTDPGITDSFAELVDFYATAMDFAGVVPGRDQFGKSLAHVLADRSAVIRTAVFCEGGRMPYEYQCDEYHAASGLNGEIPEGSMYWPRQTAQKDDQAHAKGTMIRMGDYKYVHRFGGKHEFYDLNKDPLEEINQYEHPDYQDIIVQMRLRMLDWYQETCDVVPRSYDRRMSAEAMWKRFKKKCPPEAEESIKAMIQEGAGPAKIQAALTKWEPVNT